ncbi:hypothetical protein ACTPOE_16745 [Castellaniella sp. WN]
MASLPSGVLDALTRHQIDLTHYSNGEIRRIIQLLNRADAALFEKLSAALDRLPAGSATLDQIESVLRSVREVNAAAYSQVHDGIAASMKALAPIEAVWWDKLYQHAAPEIDFAGVTAGQARAAAMSRPFQGRLLKDWAHGIEATRMARIRDTVRIGYLGGETTSEIVRRIRGTKANGYADGLLEIDRRGAESLVRTALSHTAASAREAFFEENDDILGDEIWTSTLDGRTSSICILRSGLAYDKEHRPVGHKMPYLGGPGRAHWNCRSTGIRMLKGQTQFFGTQSSADGYVDANMRYSQWLKGQPASVQDDVLGKTRAALYRRGGLDIQAFANDKGRWLSLDELQARNHAAFERAGIE